ncbi:sulfurtransferase [Cedecea sp. NFIX57]|uniref:sulfurtransferase n=1 Tax=Cedecea sp. NFIX57 TaxID=1566286 RepID=UPI000A0BF9D3|nr:rhodanese-like domain-containing protein [Cedecea sp. NFIX57]SMG30314.1 thiosulfate/3-mercaptopyruvate sulfurtransferase [Cedecea sp. NFIX57]
MLINAPDLAKRMADGEKFALIDVREQAAWETATLPGALSLNVYDYFVSDSTPKGYAAMAGAFVHAWQQLKIASGTTPVFFEQTVGMRSPRGLWFLWFALGTEGVILDGGVDAWIEAGGKLAPGTGPSAIVSDAGAPECQPAMPQLAATRAETIDVDPATAMLLDARRPAEYDGSFVHECCARAGRIPGSTLLFWEDVVENGQFKSAAELARLATEAGFTPSKRVITWCHRGARAATVLVALKLAGYENVAVYVGSWHEWASHRELPLLSGE